MANHGHTSDKTPDNPANNQHPRSLKYYLSSTTHHLNLGKFATKTFFAIKDILNKEIEIPRIKEAKAPKQKPAVKTQADVSGPEAESSEAPDQPIIGNTTEPSSKQATMEELRKLTKRSHEVLSSARTVFPFTPFPDDIVLDRTKLTITKRDFFMSGKVMSIRIEDVLNVTTDVGPLFGSITVAIRIMSSEDHITINYLHRADAIHLKHIIQGYVIAQHNKIDVAHLTKKELIETLTELGHDLSNS